MTGPSRSAENTAVTIGFRPLSREDLPLLTTWLRATHVAMWWRGEPQDLAGVEAKYGPRIAALVPNESFIVEIAGTPIGFIQRYWIANHHDWVRALAPVAVPERSIGIDYLIGERSRIGKGLGSELVRQFIGETFRQQTDATAIVVGVQQANTASWRALEKAGFTRIWAGHLESDDPSDEGPSWVYVRLRDRTDEEREHVMSSEGVMRAMVRMFATGDVASALQVVSDEYHDHQGLRGVEIRGPEGFCRVVDAARGSIQDLRVTIEDLIAEGDSVAARIRWQGRTQSGDTVDRETIDIVRVRSGHAVEHWGAQT